LTDEEQQLYELLKVNKLEVRAGEDTTVLADGEAFIKTSSRIQLIEFKQQV